MRSARRFLAALFAATLLLLGGLQSSMALAAATPTTDFTDNQDGTVTHKTTGLTWKRCSEGQTWSGSTCSGTAQAYTWNAAMALGSSGWGLPTIEQLETIIEAGHGAPTINQTVFPGTPAYHFWASSAYFRFESSAWSVNFGFATVNGLNKSYAVQVRLVRSGQSVGTSTPTASLTGLSLTCPSSLAASASASCTASASYSDGSSKTVSPASWDSSDSAALTVNGGALSAANVSRDTSVSVTASYSEGGVSKNASTSVTVKYGATASAPTPSGQGFSVSATATGDITRQTLQGRVNVHPSDIGNPGAVFAVATPPGLGTFYHGANGSWLPNVQSYFRGALAAMDVSIVENPMDLSALGGTKVYLGYTPCTPMLSAAQCYDRMVSDSGTVNLVLTLKGKLTVTTYTQPSTNGSIAALATVTSGEAQQITYWGLKDKSGKPYALTESLFNDPVSGDQFRTIYGTHGLPKQIVDLKTGNIVIIRWGLDNAEFRYYDANRKFVLGFNMAVNGSGEPVFSPLANDGRFAADPDDLTDDAEKQLQNTLNAPVTWLTQLKNKVVEKVKVLAKNITIAVGTGLCAGNPVCTNTVIAVAAGVKGGTIAYELQNNGGKHDISQLGVDLSDPDNPIYPTDRRDAYGYPILPATNQKTSSTEPPSIARAPDATIAALLKIENPPAPTNLSSSPCPDGQYLSALSNLCEITPSCPYGYVSDNKGYCIRPDMCTAPNVIQGSQCIAPTCGSTQTLKNGQCVNKLICDAYQKEVNGVCVADCNSTQDLVYGSCVTKCTPPQTRVNGSCVAPTPTYTPPPTTTTDTDWYCANPSGAWCYRIGYNLFDSDRQRCTRSGGIVASEPGRCGR